MIQAQIKRTFQDSNYSLFQIKQWDLISAVIQHDSASVPYFDLPKL